jgi:hypothetical protein
MLNAPQYLDLRFVSNSKLLLFHNNENKTECMRKSAAFHHGSFGLSDIFIISSLQQLGTLTSIFRFSDVRNSHLPSSKQEL